jgi:hypothetical protein
VNAAPLLPQPAALRLVCACRPARLPRPPFGLRSWGEAPGADVAVLLDLPREWPASGFGDIALVAAQLPDPASLERGQRVVVLPRSAAWGPWLARLVHRRSWVAGAVRASALLARGYTGIGAGVDPRSRQDLVWAHGGELAGP